MESLILLISLVLFLVYAGLIIYYRLGWKSIPDYKFDKTNKVFNTAITIIIPARNEAENIGNCLLALVNQSYPKHLYEVIVMDDHSTDNTAEIVQSFSQENIRCLALKDFVSNPINSYKKKAIDVAVSNSKGELIVTTDADCFMGPDWLSTIAAFYEEYQPAFIAAPVSIHCSNRFIEIFQALDFMTLQGITGASVHKKIHNMCNGANLAYSRKAFEEVGGFKGIDEIASGDDMLLMHKIQQHYPGKVLFLKSQDATVGTEPVDTLKSFFNQRIRWASKADKYDDKSILPVLVVVYFFNVLMLALPVMSVFSNVHYSFFSFRFSLLGYWFVLLSMKTLVELYFLFPVAGFFHKRPILKMFALMQPFHIAYTVIAGWLGKFGSYQWKDRKVK